MSSLDIHRAAKGLIYSELQRAVASNTSLPAITEMPRREKPQDPDSPTRDVLTLDCVRSSNLSLPRP